jgi:hypothetical protein
MVMQKFLKLCEMLFSAAANIGAIALLCLIALFAGLVAFTIARDVWGVAVWVQYGFAAFVGILAFMLMIGGAQALGARK